MAHAAGITRIVLVALLLSSCDGGDVGPPDDDGNNPGNVTAGRFSATVTGAVTKTFEGQALFQVSAPTAAATFGLGMFGTQVANQVGITRAGGRRPAPGSYALESLASVVLRGSGFSGVLGLTEGTLGQITSGTLTVTTSTASTFEGTTRFAAVLLTPAGAELNVSIDITFNATCNTICN